MWYTQHYRYNFDKIFCWFRQVDLHNDFDNSWWGKCIFATARVALDAEVFFLVKSQA